MAASTQFRQPGSSSPACKLAVMGPHQQPRVPSTGGSYDRQGHHTVALLVCGFACRYGYVSFFTKEAADLAISTFDDQLQLQVGTGLRSRQAGKATAGGQVHRQAGSGHGAVMCGSRPQCSYSSTCTYICNCRSADSVLWLVRVFLAAYGSFVPASF